MSTSGIKRLIDPNFKFALLFSDNQCPYCGEMMYLDESLKIKGNIVRNRFICPNCGLIVPLYHDKDDNISPVYDESIYSFISDFGENIIDRKMKV